MWAAMVSVQLSVFTRILWNSDCTRLTSTGTIITGFHVHTCTTIHKHISKTSGNCLCGYLNVKDQWCCPNHSMSLICGDVTYIGCGKGKGDHSTCSE